MSMDDPQMWSQDEITRVKEAMSAAFHSEEYEVYQNDPVAMDPELLYISTDWDEEGLGIEKISPTSFCIWSPGKINDHSADSKPLDEIIKELISSEQKAKEV